MPHAKLPILGQGCSGRGRRSLVSSARVGHTGSKMTPYTGWFSVPMLLRWYISGSNGCGLVLWPVELVCGALPSCQSSVCRGWRSNGTSMSRAEDELELETTAPHCHTHALNDLPRPNSVAFCRCNQLGSNCVGSLPFLFVCDPRAIWSTQHN